MGVVYIKNYYNQGGKLMEIKVYGTNLFETNIEEVTKQNGNYRTAIWTGVSCKLP